MAILRICSVDGCDKPVRALGWCSAHYQRANRLGDPLAKSTGKTGPKPKPVIERFLAFVPHRPTPEACWIWTGAKSPSGYGQFGIGPPAPRSSRMRPAHRVSHELFIGPIPEGLFVMHMCDVPSCVNPNHLRAGTHSENMQDCIAKNRHSRFHSSKTHCPQGHPYDENNTRRDREGYRVCRKCENAASARGYRKRRLRAREERLKPRLEAAIERVDRPSDG